MDGFTLTGPGFADACRTLRQRMQEALAGLETLEALLRGSTALHPVATPAEAPAPPSAAAPSPPEVIVLRRQTRISDAERARRAERMRQMLATRPPRQRLIEGEREAKLRELWPTAMPGRDVAAALNAMGGPAVTATQCRDRANQLGLQRPQELRSETWNAARDALLRARYPTIAAVAELLPALNALPGAAVLDEQQIYRRVKALRIRRESGTSVASPRADKMTPARAEVMRARWTDPAFTPGQILEAVNALPGRPYVSTSSLYAVAERLGLPARRPAPVRSLDDPRPPQPPAPTPQPAPAAAASPAPAAPTPEPEPPPLTPEQEAAQADAALLAKHAKAKAMLALPGADALRIASATKLPAREVMRLQGELRRQKAGAAR